METSEDNRSLSLALHKTWVNGLTFIFNPFTGNVGVEKFNAKSPVFPDKLKNLNKYSLKVHPYMIDHLF